MAAKKKRAKASKAVARKRSSPGQPAFEPSEEQRSFVRMYIQAGYTQADIAAVILNPHTGEGIDEKTLRHHFRRELDLGVMNLLGEAAMQLGRMAVGAPAVLDAKGRVVRAELQPNLGAICFLMKTRGKKQGWSERLELTGDDGGAIRTAGARDTLAAKLKKMGA